MATILVYPKEQAEGAGNDTDTLQAAIDAASPGDVLLLKATNIGGAPKKWLLAKQSGATFPAIHILGVSYPQDMYEVIAALGVDGNGDPIPLEAMQYTMQNIIVNKNLTLKGEVDGDGKPLTKICARLTTAEVDTDSLTQWTSPTWYPEQGCGGKFITCGSVSNHRPRVRFESLMFENQVTGGIRAYTLTDIVGCTFKHIGVACEYQLDNRITYPSLNFLAATPDFSNPNKCTISGNLVKGIIGSYAFQLKGSEIDFIDNHHISAGELASLAAQGGMWGYGTSDGFLLSGGSEDHTINGPQKARFKYCRNILVENCSAIQGDAATYVEVNLFSAIGCQPGGLTENIVFRNNTVRNGSHDDPHSGNPNGTWYSPHLNQMFLLCNGFHNLLAQGLKPSYMPEEPKGVFNCEFTGNTFYGCPSMIGLLGKVGPKAVGRDYNLYPLKNVLCAANVEQNVYRIPSEGDIPFDAFHFECAENITVTQNDFTTSGRLGNPADQDWLATYFIAVKDSLVFNSGMYPHGTGGAANHYGQAPMTARINIPAGTVGTRIRNVSNRIIGVTAQLDGQPRANDFRDREGDFDYVRLTRKQVIEAAQA